MKTTEKIKKIEEHRKVLIDRLLEVEDILCGSYNTVFRKCGKETCWCKDATQSHAYSRFICRDNKTGATTTRAVHENEKEWVMQCTANYKEVRDMLKRLGEVNKELLEAIELMIKERTAKTGKMKRFQLFSDK